MPHPPLAAGWIDRPHLRLPVGDLALESGETLRDAFVSYVVHGDPSHLVAGNAMLACTAIGSTHHRLDFLIGPGAALDTDRHCIVVADALGNGLSSSPSNSAVQPGAAFPRISIRDMIESQRRLLDHLGASRLKAIVGASMGGMQALQWGVSEPGRMERIVAMTPMARTARWSQLVNEMARRALFTDAGCTLPRPRAEAMRLWAPLAQFLMPRSPEALEAFESHEFLLAEMARAEREAELHGPDAFDWCCQSRAYDAHDVGTTAGFGGDTERALASIEAEVLIAAPLSDLYNPPFMAREAARSIRRARVVDLPGHDGHRSASGVSPLSTERLRDEIAAFLRG